ncbi:hypothetical protein GCM10023336_31140 [Streptomyces similanensis]|uniref:Transposase n=1 Tax=Streptomyces similanensis TaxID=1274988 RepID=A0ABP9KI14_9ACTN
MARNATGRPIPGNGRVTTRRKRAVAVVCMGKTVWGEIGGDPWRRYPLRGCDWCHHGTDLRITDGDRRREKA